MPDVFERLDRLAATGDHEAVTQIASGALSGATEHEAADLWRYLAWARFELSDFDASLEAARFADDALFEAKAHFHLWQFPEAEVALGRLGQALETVDEDEAEAEWYRALLCEFSGTDSEPHYRAAEALAPELFSPPVPMLDEEVDAVVAEALAQLPAAVAHAIEDAAVTVVALPSPHPDVDPLSLGLYVGADRMQRALEGPPELPPRIEVYRKNIERLAENPDEAIEELRITLLHEIAHHLGFDEAGVESLGLE